MIDWPHFRIGHRLLLFVCVFAFHFDLVFEILAKIGERKRNGFFVTEAFGSGGAALGVGCLSSGVPSLRVDLMSF